MNEEKFSDLLLGRVEFRYAMALKFILQPFRIKFCFFDECLSIPLLKHVNYHYYYCWATTMTTTLYSVCLDWHFEVILRHL
jgi:hypothetical protein